MPSLSIVGTGIRLSGQITTEATSLIRDADVVFAAMADTMAVEFLRDMNPEVRALHNHYAEGRQRDETYRRMVEAILAPVRRGKRVCAAFYGHPGVFVWPSHEAIRLARQEGYSAAMFPAVSAEDCLFADLGLDPARSGCQSYEATDFLLYGRRIDPTAALILWQPAALGDYTRSTFKTDAAWVAALADVLGEHYPPGHEVIVYEAAAFPLDEPRIESVPLASLADVAFTQASTLYLPPAQPPCISRERLSMLGVDENDIAVANFQRDRDTGRRG